MEHVLVCEDTFELLEMMRLTLSIEGYRVTATQNGTEMVSLARADRPDLILLDVVMPEVSGFDVARELQQHEETRDIPIIFVTARSDMDDLVHGLEVAVDYIAKPFAVPELVARVRAALRMQKLQRELRDKNEQLEHLAITDALTGVLNRRGFDRQLESEVHRARRENISLGLALFDLDRFKEVNDTYGHPQGDLVLRHFAQVLLSCSRRSDLLGRIGGEEFALLLPSTDMEGTEFACEKVRERLEKSRISLTREHAGTRLSITVSAGAVVVMPSEMDDAAPLVVDLYRTADRNLYRAKDAGRNRVVVTLL